MNTIQYIKKHPYWELAATEIGYAICVQDFDGKYFDLFPIMKPPSPDDEKRIREDGLNTNEIFDQFVDKHFLRLVGTNIDNSPEEHRKFINSYTNLKKYIYEEGPGGAKNVIDSVDDLTRTDVIINIMQVLYCPNKKKPIEMRMSFTFGHLKTGYGLYESSLSGGMDGENISVTYNLNAVDKIISGCLTDISGYCVKRKLCTMENINEWFSILPFEHKILAIDEAFKPAEVLQ